jgi:hypothetical protein
MRSRPHVKGRWKSRPRGRLVSHRRVVGRGPELRQWLSGSRGLGRGLRAAGGSVGGAVSGCGTVLVVVLMIGGSRKPIEENGLSCSRSGCLLDEEGVMTL